MRKKLWTVGFFLDGEVETFGPFSKETAEEMFKRLNEEAPTGATPFIKQLRNWGDET